MKLFFTLSYPLCIRTYPRLSVPYNCLHLFGILNDNWRSLVHRIIEPKSMARSRRDSSRAGGYVTPFPGLRVYFGVFALCYVGASVVLMHAPVCVYSRLTPHTPTWAPAELISSVRWGVWVSREGIVSDSLLSIHFDDERFFKKSVWGRGRWWLGGCNNRSGKQMSPLPTVRTKAIIGLVSNRRSSHTGKCRPV